MVCLAELSSAALELRNNNVSLQQIIRALMLVKIIESFILGFLLISKVNLEGEDEEKPGCQNVFQACREENLIER